MQEKYTKEEIIEIIENEMQDWENTNKKLLKNNKLLDEYKEKLHDICKIRTETLDTLKYRF